MTTKDITVGFVAGILLSTAAYWVFLRPAAGAPPPEEAAAGLRKDGFSRPAMLPAESADSFPRETSAGPPSQEGRNPSVTALLKRLGSMEVTSRRPQSVRQLLVELERLREAGPAALPAIREFLAGAQDADYDGVGRSGWSNGRMPAEFMVPPSLRLGLLETVKHIGGPEAEAILVAELQSTGRGAEVSYIAGALQEIAPDRHRDAAFAAARDLLAMPLSTRAPNALDRSDRELLFGVLKSGNDRSYVEQAQAQLVLPDGRLDRPALSYLQSMLGSGTAGIAERLWQDPRLPGREKSSLARAAVNYVGVAEEADRLFETALGDAGLSNGQRRDLIEDLEDSGLPSLRRLSAKDLPVIERRLALIDRLEPRAGDERAAQAFKETREELQRARDAILRPAAPSKK